MCNLDGPTYTIKIWFAGFYEGEGSISNDISNRNKLRINISQNDKTPLIEGQKIWGGYIYERVRKSPSSDKICCGHEWRLNHNEAITFINDIKPYLLIPYKIKQIETCFSKLNENGTKNLNVIFVLKNMLIFPVEEGMKKRNILIKVYILNAKNVIKNTNQKIH